MRGQDPPVASGEGGGADLPRRTRQLLLVQGTLVALTALVIAVGWAAGLLSDRSGGLSAAFTAFVVGYTALAWLLYRRDPSATYIAPALLYVDAAAGVVGFYLLGEFETPNLALVVLAVTMAPMYTRKAHAWGIAGVAVACYCGLVALRWAGVLGYEPVLEALTAEQLSDASFLADSVGGFLILLFGAAFLAGKASLEIHQTRAELEETVRRRTRDLRARSDELEAANDRLAEHDRLKTRFFSNVSHELRTPLTLIMGPLEGVLSHPELPTPVRDQLRSVLRNARRLLWRINQLLDLTRLDAGGTQLALVRLDAVTFVHRRVAAFESLAERRRIQLDFVPDAAQLLAVFDPDRVEQIVFNLLSNALKFTGPGGKVRVSVHRRESPEPILELRVQDTGCGIPTHQLDRLFDRFFQVESDGEQEARGTGIGLALVRELVEMHGGSIDVESEQGLGSTFIVRLPLDVAGEVRTGEQEEVSTRRDLAAATVEVAEPVSSGAWGPATDEYEPARPTRPTVVLVDDNAEVLSFLRSVLAADYILHPASDGLEGVELVRRVQPHLVISDVMMPRVDGYELCRRLKADPDTREIPVILLTAKASPEMTVEGLECGADDYLSKPFDRAELKARVRNLVQKADRERRLHELTVELEERVTGQVRELLRSQRLGRFLPRQVVERVLGSDEDVRVRAERRLVTILFSDLTGFTALSDGVAPERITAVLNEYLGAMLRIVERRGGMIDKIMGDGLMVLWGATEETSPAEQAAAAVEAATEMQREMVALGELWRAGGLDHQVRLRIGVHQDYVTVGTFGLDELMSFTAIGGGVNTAARLEASCPVGQVHVSYVVHALTVDRFGYTALEERHFKGLRPMKTASLSVGLEPGAAGSTGQNTPD